MIRLLLLLCLSLPTAAAIDPLAFESEAQERRFKDLVMELRCPKCQNQAIGDSDAPIAQDMRVKVHELMIQGNDNNQIIEWLEQRYGSYVRYKPQFGGNTLWLWLLPPLFLALGGVVVARVMTRRRELSDAERAQADELLGIKS